VIDQYRRHPASTEPPINCRENSIIAALRTQLAAKDDEIRKLRTHLREHETTIALLYGRLDQTQP
jgi:hypothetical protein